MTNIIRCLFELVISNDREAKLRGWASDNAYTLIFIFGLTVVTWLLIIVTFFAGAR